MSILCQMNLLLELIWNSLVQNHFRTSSNLTSKTSKILTFLSFFLYTMYLNFYRNPYKYNLFFLSSCRRHHHQLCIVIYSVRENYTSHEYNRTTRRTKKRIKLCNNTWVCVNFIHNSIDKYTSYNVVKNIFGEQRNISNVI